MSPPWSFLLPVLLMCTACSPRRVAERLVLGGTVAQAEDVAYGPDPRQRLDVYRSRNSPAGAPVIVFIHGGRWKYSSKHDYLLMGNALARRGYVVVVASYRLFPAVKYPAWVEDGAQAVRWTRDHIARFGGDPSRIVMMGHSSGAHTVTMLALDHHFLRDAGVPEGAVTGFISLAGPVDTTWTDADVQELMGPSAGWPATYAYNFIDGSTAPLLLLHGADDDVVTPANSIRLAERIRKRGGCARAIEYPGIGHAKIALALVFPRVVRRRVREDVEAFVAEPRGFACATVAAAGRALGA